MRPERIVVEGFGTFRDRTEIDFTGADLFALTGPTGAGKSTIIDAIVFALYGVVPRLDDKKAVAPVISQDRVEAKVQVDFAVGDEHYTAVRVVREVVSKARREAADPGPRTANTREARLERRVPDGDDEVLAGTADELTAAVETLLGLTFEHFTTCVVLPQGQFARFLHHKPRHRQDLLVELLDLGVYAEMATLARSREKAAQQQAEWLGKQRAELDFARPEVADACRHRVKALDELLQWIDEQQPALDAAEQSVAQLRQQLADVDDCVQRLSTVVLPRGVGDLATETEAAVEAARLAAAASREATEKRRTAEDARGLLGDRTSFEVAKRQHAEQRDLEARVRKGEAVVDEETAKVVAVEATAQTAGAEHAAAVSALDAARLANQAAAVATQVVAGEACPVCGQTVHEVPKHKAPALKKAEQAESSTRRSAERATAELAAAKAKQASVVDLLTERRDNLAAVLAGLADAPSADEVEATLTAIEAAELAVAQARTDERAALDAAAAADRAKVDIEDRSTGAWRTFDGVRDRVAVLEPPPAERADLRAAWASLVAWADEQTERYSETRVAIVAETEQVTALLDSRRASVRQRCVDLEVEPGRRTARDAVVEALAQAKADVTSVESALATVVELDTQLHTSSTEQQLAGTVARHLSANGFEKWVLDEALERLVLGATGILHELSGGAYSLVLDGRTSNFFVRDHKNADALRSARTLSGGETFLASLALALALADQVAEMAAGGAVRLESIFLDEGFGTLDPETLDTVASAIEELGARGRMVGLVSHVRELAERMPVRFVVSKGPATSTVERVEL